MGLRVRRHGRYVGLATALLASAAIVLVSGPAAADQHWEVVADGLSNPRHVDAGPGGRLYVAEAGRGGDTLVDVIMADGRNPICVGETGRITEVFRGRQRAVVQLPSWAGASGTDEEPTCPGDGAFAIGPQGVAVDGRGSVSAAIGLAASPPDLRSDITENIAAAAHFGTVQRLLPNGRMRTLGDPAAFEQTDNPDRSALPDSNPYGTVRDDDGSRLVTDAGGNTLVRVHGDGDTSTVAVFAPQCVAWELPFPNPIPDDANPCGTAEQFPAQPVPTDVAIGPDGDYYVSLLGGFPFTVGASRVWRIDADRTTPATCSTFAPAPNDGCEIYASDLTSIVGIAFGPDATLYAVQIADDGVFALEFGGSDAGSVQVIPPGEGRPSSSVGGLNAPGGVAVRGDDLYVTNRSVSPDTGQLLTAPTP